ncbi:MAG TPA: toprim domain-containing protein [Mesotoga sp.]|nr:toprim domain-containing protein [Mesotoga sp.]
MRLKNRSGLARSLDPYLKNYLYDNFKIDAKHKIPFPCVVHNDGRTNSMVYYDDPGDEHVYCFGSCKKMWRTVDLCMEVEGLSFDDALLKLLNKYGITYEEEVPTEDIEAMFKAAYEYTMNFNPKQLGGDVRNYLEGKRVTIEEIREFGVGYVSDYNQYHMYMCSKFKPDLLKTFGLIESNPQYPIRFAPRSLMYAILDESGNPKAFQARDCHPNPPSKSKNTNNVEGWFVKSEWPHGLHMAAKSKSKNSAYIVEGPFDAIRLWLNGIYNAVAINGSSIAEGSAESFISKLKKLGYTGIIFVLDGDEAGISGTCKLIENILPKMDILSAVKKLPDGLDPDEFVMKNGIQAFRSLRLQHSAAYWYENNKNVSGEDSIYKSVELLSKLKVSDIAKAASALAASVNRSDFSLGRILDIYKTSVLLESNRQLIHSLELTRSIISNISTVLNNASDAMNIAASLRSDDERGSKKERDLCAAQETCQDTA